MKRDKALQTARSRGWVVRQVRSAGEVDVLGPNGERVRLHATRKYAPRALTTLLRRYDPEGGEFPPPAAIPAPIRPRRPTPFQAKS